MTVKITNSGGYLAKDFGATKYDFFTMAGWYRWPGFVSPRGIAAFTKTSGDGSDLIAAYMTDRIRLNNVTATNAFNPASVGDWVYIAFQRDASGRRAMFVWNGSTWTDVLVSGAGTYTSVVDFAYASLGTNAGSYEDTIVDGEYRYWRLWAKNTSAGSTALDKTALALELASATPVQTTDLIAHWPLASDLNDSYSTNHLTASDAGHWTTTANEPPGIGASGVKGRSLLLGVG